MPDAKLPYDLHKVARTAQAARRAVEARDAAIRAARADGAPVRAIAQAAGTTHPTVMKIVAAGDAPAPSDRIGG